MGQAGSLDRARGQLVNEHVVEFVRVAGHEVRCARPEHDEMTVVTDLRFIAGSRHLIAGAVDAYTSRRFELTIVDENVAHAICVARYQVGGVGCKSHVASVAADRRSVTYAVRLGSIGMHADSFKRACRQVDNEHISHAIGIPAGDKIGCLRSEGDDLTVVTDGRIQRVSVRLHAAGQDGHSLVEAGLTILQEDIGESRCVSRQQVRGRRSKRDVVSVCAE